MTDVLEAPSTDMLGKRVKRTEDPRFITGKGRYLDDIKLQSMTHIAVLRSPYAHANIRSIDTSAATKMPGVIAAFTGADIPYNPLPMAWPAGGSAGIQNNVNTPRTLATDSVKWTGEGVAAVVAETEAQAIDALEAITVDWEPLPTVVDAEKATQPGAPQLHSTAPNNIVFEWSVGDKNGTASAIDAAEVVVKQRLVNQRLIPNPMETRGVLTLFWIPDAPPAGQAIGNGFHGMSAPTITASTPGIVLALDVSTERMFAWAYGLRRIAM